MLPEETSMINSTTRIGQAVNFVRRLLKAASCALHDGEVYRKITEAKYTFIRYKTVKAFLMEMLSDQETSEYILPHINQLIFLLSDPNCGLIESIRMDYNFIEVKPEGYCFNIEKKEFVKDPPNLKGSPRAFVLYDYNGKIPTPKYFIEGNTIFF